jgi:5-methylcytosine-specific restriction endonuclease McrA
MCFVDWGSFMEQLEIVKRLTNDELVLRVRHCVREDRRVSAQLLAHLGEIEARGLHRDLGYESMFEYAVRLLHMSDSEAGLRLSQLTTAAPTCLTQSEAVRGAGTSKLNQPTTVAPTARAQSDGDRSAGSAERPLLASPIAQPSNREPAVPLSEGRYKIVFTAGQRARDLLQEAQDLFRNQLPNGDIDVLFERALVLLVAERKKQLYAQTDKARRSSPTTSTNTAATSKSSSRHIPSAIKRRVYARDKGQCRFLSPTGERCCARSRLEFHHIQAFGFGGPPTEKNIVLFCRAHNVLMAERDFSREHIQRCIQASQSGRAQDTGAKPSAQVTARRTDARLTAARFKHAAAHEQSQLNMPQYKPTRSGISEPRERNSGLNQSRARKPESQNELDD